MGIEVSQDLTDDLYKFLKERIATPLIGGYDYIIAIENDTGTTLQRVGTHNDSENWPIGDLPPGKTVGGLKCKSFSIAAKYRGGGKNYVIACSSPVWGRIKINLKVDDVSPKSVWDDMEDGGDKVDGNSRALITTAEGKNTWLFILKP